MKQHEFLTMIYDRSESASYCQLSIRTGLKDSELSRIRNGERPPTDRQILALCLAANLDPAPYLVLGNTWRTKSPDAAKLYSQIAAKMLSAALGSVTLAVLLITTSAPHAEPLQNSAQCINPVIYIMRQILARICSKIKTIRIAAYRTTPISRLCNPAQSNH